MNADPGGLTDGVTIYYEAALPGACDLPLGIGREIAIVDLMDNPIASCSIPCQPTFFQVLVLVEGLDGVLLGESAEGVDEMRAEVRVDVGGAELGRALPVDGPVGEVAHHPLPAHRDRRRRLPL